MSDADIVKLILGTVMTAMKAQSDKVENDQKYTKEINNINNKNENVNKWRR